MVYYSRETEPAPSERLVMRIVLFFALIGFLYFFNHLGAPAKMLIYIILGAIMIYLLQTLFLVHKEVKTLASETEVLLSDPSTIIQKLREINPKQFEDIVSLFFEMEGYDIVWRAPWKKTRGTRNPGSDKGIDLIVRKEGKTTYVQVKKLITRQVASSVIRNFYGSITGKLQEGDRGIVITTSLFSQDARVFAVDTGVTMVDYTKLLKRIDNLSEQHAFTLATRLNTMNTQDNLRYKKYAKTCPRCYAPLVKRTSRKSKDPFYGCMNYHFTGCRYTEPVPKDRKLLFSFAKYF